MTAPTALDHLDNYALTAGVDVTVELTTDGRYVEGTVTDATAYVLVLARNNGAIVSRVPWRAVASITTLPTRHPAI